MLFFSLSTVVFLRVIVHSPAVFLLFTKDILSQKTDITYLLMAQLFISASFRSTLLSPTGSKSHLVTTSSINSDFKKISHWGRRKLVTFNAFKTQLLFIFLSKTPHKFLLSFNSSVIPPLNTVNILCITAQWHLIYP